MFLLYSFLFNTKYPLGNTSYNNMGAIVSYVFEAFVIPIITHGRLNLNVCVYLATQGPNRIIVQNVQNY